MNFRRSITILFSICALTFSTFAYDCYLMGIYYNLNHNAKTASVTHTIGESYKGDILIPESITYNDTIFHVTSIGSRAFQRCSSLTSVVIPNTVTTIEKYAFYGCTSLSSVKVPNSVTYIGSDAFYGCSSLTSIIIPNSGATIGDDAFRNCKSLKEIIQPAETIEQYLADKPFISWDDYYAKKHTKKRPMNKEEITERISKEMEVWQKKDEFETTAQWSDRVNEKTRAEKIDSLKKQYIGIAQKEQNEYLQEVETLKKNYQTAYRQYYESISNRYITILTELKTADFQKEVFDLSSPYDADHQSFLIQTSSYGDILLPVPLSDAPSFKENWNTIKNKISPTFAFDGKDAVLSKLTFTNNGKKYVYDSQTEAKYAVADINYNFTPLELEASDFDLNDLDINAPEIGSPEIAQTIAKKSDAPAIGKKKAEVGRQSITVGSGPTKSDIDTSIPRVERNSDKTFALIIANENYRREGNVPYALNDGKILAEYFKSTLGIPEKNIQLYTDASLNDIKYGVNKLTQICDAFGNQASVIVYYAGHGIPDEKSGNAHLLPVDGYGSDASTGYSLQELYETLGALPSKQALLLLDACFSGSQRTGDMMASNARGVRIKAKPNTAKGNLIVLSATQGDETAYPYEEKQHGMFTYFLLKKLNEDKGDVSLGELADYVIANVKQTSILMNDKLQTPTINVSPTLSSKWQNIKIGQ